MYRILVKDSNETTQHIKSYAQTIRIKLTIKTNKTGHFQYWKKYDCGAMKAGKAIQHNKSVKVSWCRLICWLNKKRENLGSRTYSERNDCSSVWNDLSTAEFKYVGERDGDAKVVKQYHRTEWGMNKSSVKWLERTSFLQHNSSELLTISDHYNSHWTFIIAERTLLSSSLRGINVNKRLICPFLNKIKIKLQKQKY